MDAELIYTLSGVAVFALFAYFILKNDTAGEVQSKEEKRYEIISGYQACLRKELSPLQDNKEEYLAKKVLLLKEFSDELSMNIFFDSLEIEEIIQDLATQSY